MYMSVKHSRLRIPRNCAKQEGDPLRIFLKNF